MKVAVYSQPNILFECLELLCRYENNEDTRAVLCGLQDKYRLDTPELLQAFEPIIELGEYVYNGVNADEERLAFFFRSQGHEKWCCARMLLHSSLHAYMPHPEAPDADFKPLVPMPKEQRLQQYTQHLKHWFAGELDGSTDLVVQNDADLINWIDSFDVDVQEKWLLSLLYQNYDAYMQELLPILNRAASLYREKLDIVSPLLEGFEARYRELVASKPIERLNSKLQIKLLDDKQVHIVPQVIGFNMVTYLSHTGTAEAETLYIGVLFETLEEIVRQSVSDEEICRTLKMLSDPSKFAILKYIRRQPAYGSELAEQLGLSTATISHHMNALIQQGFVQIEKQANRIYYRMNREAVEKYLDLLQTSLLQN